jgi:hypothetical protein
MSVKIAYLDITVSPEKLFDGQIKLRFRITLADGQILGYDELVEENHFQDLFDYMFRKAQFKIREELFSPQQERKIK